MPLTVAQRRDWFLQVIGLPQATYDALANECVTGPDDLTEFEEDAILHIVKYLKNPGDRIPDPNPGAAPGATIPRPPYVVGALSQQRMIQACDFLKYYEAVGRDLTPANISLNIMRYFTKQ